MNIRSWISNNPRTIAEIISAIFLVVIAGFKTQEVNELNKKLKEILGNEITTLIPEEEKYIIMCLNNNGANILNNSQTTEKTTIYSEIPELVKEQAEEVAGKLGLCISRVKRDYDEKKINL